MRPLESHDSTAVRQQQLDRNTPIDKITRDANTAMGSRMREVRGYTKGRATARNRLEMKKHNT